MAPSEKEQEERASISELGELDRAYEPFPDFAFWSETTQVAEPRWKRYRTQLDHLRRGVDQATQERSFRLVRRAAAVDTGALENLYEVDRGFTYTVAAELAHWEVALEERGESVRNLVFSQLSAYDYVLDLATRAEPVSEKLIREIHEAICNGQETYEVLTRLGRQEHRLDLGSYKRNPNHVLTRSGERHSYAPVEMTRPEMARIVANLETATFQDAHPVQQAAYAHYALVAVHPFQDGNGRVARALASVYTYRALGVPVLVLNSERDQYLHALERADHGKRQAFVDFILEATLNSIQLVADSLQAAWAPEAEASLSQLSEKYFTRGGYRHTEVDNAGAALLASTKDALASVAAGTATGNEGLVKLSFGSLHPPPGPVPDGYRLPNGLNAVIATMETSGLPSEVRVEWSLEVQVPNDSGAEDDLTVVARAQYETEASRVLVFPVRASELIPSVTRATEFRAHVFATGIVNRMTHDLTLLAK